MLPSVRIFRGQSNETKTKGGCSSLEKKVFARPRPVVTYVGKILALSQSATPAILSDHATMSVALVLLFIKLVIH